MPASPADTSTPAPVLLCFDGSAEAATAIARAGRLLGPRPAVVLTVWEPVRQWAAFDPATIVTAPLTALASRELGLDEICRDVAAEHNHTGVALAAEAGFDATGRVAGGKPWREICDLAGTLDAEAIVLGARGMGRIESALLGGVSAAVVTHATRPVLVVHHPGGR